LHLIIQIPNLFSTLMTIDNDMPAGSIGTLTVYLRYTQRVTRMQALTHMTPGALLLLTGLSDLLGGESHGLMTWLSVLSGGAVLFAAFRELVPRGRHPHGGVRWLDVIAAIMLCIEALHRFKPDKGFQVAFGYLLAAVLTFLVGVFHGRLLKQRFVKFGPRRLQARTHLFSSLSIPWAEVLDFAPDGNRVVITTRSGGRVLSLRRFANREEVFSAFERYRRCIPPPAQPGEPPAAGEQSAASR
jgi:hypothetical protein